MIVLYKSIYVILGFKALRVYGFMVLGFVLWLFELRPNMLFDAISTSLAVLPRIYYHHVAGKTRRSYSSATYTPRGKTGRLTSGLHLSTAHVAIG